MAETRGARGTVGMAPVTQISEILRQINQVRDESRGGQTRPSLAYSALQQGGVEWLHQKAETASAWAGAGFSFFGEIETNSATPTSRAGLVENSGSLPHLI